MKKIFIFPILMLFFFSKCEKVVDIDVPSISPKLIIDASFDVFASQNPVTANTTVKLNLSADYFEETIPPAQNATVFITDLSNNSITNFSDILGNGNYTPVTSFLPEYDKEYELTVIYENQTYKGKATRVKSEPLTRVSQGDKTLFSGEETELKVEFPDNGATEDYYLFDFTNNLFLAVEDRFFNGSDYNFSYFYGEDDIELPTTVTIKKSGITKEYFTYFRVLINQSGQNAGGPFETVPSSLLGNIINTTNEGNFPLGYFHISDTSTYDVKLVDKSE